jgi:acyl carrier protein
MGIRGQRRRIAIANRSHNRRWSPHFWTYAQGPRALAQRASTALALGPSRVEQKPCHDDETRRIDQDSIVTQETLQQTVIGALTGIAPEVDPSTLDPDINFRDQFELDSVDYLNFVLTLEQRLAIKIPEMDYPRLSCLNGCLTYLGNATEVTAR